MPASKTLIRRDAVFISENMNKLALVKAMRLHGLTATKVIKPIVEALEANKSVVMGKDEDAFVDIQPDHSTRLRAAQLAIELLGLKKDLEFAQPPNKDNKALTKALQNADEVELQRIIFNKK